MNLPATARSGYRQVFIFKLEALNTLSQAKSLIKKENLILTHRYYLAIAIHSISIKASFGNLET